MFFTLLQKSARSMMSAASVKTLILCASLTALLMFAWVGGIYILLNQTSMLTSSWMDSALDWVLGGGSVIVAYFLFPILLPVIASMFLDGFMEKIASREYGKTLRSVPLTEELPKTLMFVAQALLINVVLLPIYFILLFVPPLNLILYYSVNGYLLSKEFWVMVCDRMNIQSDDRRRQRTMLFVAGIALMFAANIPFLNLMTPLIAAAYMLHLGFYCYDRGWVTPKNNGKQALQLVQDVLPPENL